MGESYIVNAHNVIETDERIKTGTSFRRLAVLEALENLKEEIEELSNILKSDLKQDKTDLEVDELRAKLKNIEKAIVGALR